ncbi:hypothetical protein SAMN05444285_1157 [Draconibacterium orientale]|uniref:ATPase AAA n=1 Tax=Draconibacterium orientale TaxID=1168034 RepID=X5DD70_9BACT|nr:AAA family ATPase [Draconibacterium orientale]AHW58934.1 ATPase AAA [Draconibacterium orientale]SET50813.1 hypothetical protein SAMN05444285_1157 [Draconibacterium orientale]
MEQINILYQSILSRTNTKFIRFLFNKINLENRMNAIIGSRGAGKTTLLLQLIKQKLPITKTLYLSADNIYLTNLNLFELAQKFSNTGGLFLFIDEIHKYPNWSQELKMIYDYLPDLKVVFTGSSILDIYKGYADLSRRVLTYYLPGLSFREYIEFKTNNKLPVYSLEQIVKNEISFDGFKPLEQFSEYIKSGYFPFFKEPGYIEKLNNTINLTLETDIPNHTGMNIATVNKLKQLLYIVSQSVPFKPNMSKIAEMIGINRNQVAEYLHYFERAGLILQLREATKGIRLMGKVQKIYLNNPNFIHLFAEGNPNIGNIRETFFFNQMSPYHQVFSAQKGDFTVDSLTFEIGGKSKNNRQIKNVENSYIVKDDIEYGSGNTIPLWAFGLTY